MMDVRSEPKIGQYRVHNTVFLTGHGVTLRPYPDTLAANFTLAGVGQ